MPHTLPNEQLAREIVAETLGWLPSSVQRFTSGLAYFVFDVWDGERNVVVRLGRSDQASALRDGVTLAARLRPLGLPLPETLATGSMDGFPFFVQTRLPGTDLGQLMNDLDPPSLRGIAIAVADAQAATARLGNGTRFGYAATADAAPHDRWSDVVAVHIARSEQRIAANGLFPREVVDQARALFSRHLQALNGIPATPFLHDTTTKNVIVTPDGQFSGIVDVDDLCFGDPRYTPALTKVAMLVHGGPLDYVDTWMVRADQAQDDLFRFYIAVFLLDFMSEHGTRFNGNETVSDAPGRARLLQLFAQSLSG